MDGDKIPQQKMNRYEKIGLVVAYAVAFLPLACLLAWLLTLTLRTTLLLFLLCPGFIIASLIPGSATAHRFTLWWLALGAGLNIVYFVAVYFLGTRIVRRYKVSKAERPPKAKYWKCIGLLA